MKPFNNLFSIRAKLIFLSSLLLLIPVLVYQYILAMDEYLRSGQELTVLGEARALATALNDRPELFDEGTFGRATRTGDLYIYPVYSPLSLNDGSLVDWGAYQQYELDYGASDYLRTPLNPARIYAHDESLSFRSMVGEHNGSLYAYFKVRDENIVYRSRESLSVIRSDFLQISMLTANGRDVERIVIAPHEPEYLYPFRVNEDYADPVYEERISGQWYEVDGGYEIELQIPTDILGGRIGFAIFDVDDPVSRDIATVIATHKSLDGHRLGSLQRPTPEIDRIVAGMGRSNSHIQVVDRSGRVLLTVGDIQSATGLILSNINNPPSNRYWTFVQNNVLTPLYNLILTQPSTNFIDDVYSEVAREGDHIAAALDGEPFTRFRELADTQTMILEASHPIFAGDEVIGAVIVDQNMNGLRSFRNQALEGLFNTIIAVMLAVTLGLFLFASRISNRVRGLRNQAEGIIDDSGRVRNTIVPSPNSDEIGDLSRSFSSIVERLSQYTSYLENMSSRLSHELRTPVTVVRSSIENLGSTDNAEESQVYIKRAEEGISRLNLILTNMSEATRLEQMLQTSEKEIIDLAEVVKGCVEGYRLAYPDSNFTLDIGGYSIFVKGVPEYVAQLLDKLIANAVEFSHAEQPIIVNCHVVRDQAVVRISNSGPYLPQEMKDRIFESMVSVRPHQKQKQPHLGMGLHIARLITDFHNGQIRADNREDAEGVTITVSIPLSYR